MRDASAGFDAALQRNVTSICQLWEVTRADGVVLRFTNAVNPVDWDGKTFRSDVSFTTSAIFTSTSAANLQNVTMTVLMDEQGFREDDLRSRRYDNAIGNIYLVDYEATEYDLIAQYRGTFGLIRITDKRIAQIDLAPISSGAARSLGTEVYQGTCRHSFGDSGCKKDLKTVSVNVDVRTIVGASRAAFTMIDPHRPDNYFSLGFVTWSTGENAGTTSQVQTSSGATITLVAAPARGLSVGDTGVMVPGCDKLPLTCLNKYNNIVNFDAEPFVPPQDQLPLIGMGGLSAG